MTRKSLAFYGSSLLSSYWNGAATYYRGILAALAPLGWDITFYEPDAFDRQSHRDIDPPDYAHVEVYPATPDALAAVLAKAGQADVVVKASGVGVFDDELVAGIVAHARPDALKVFWDVDAPATLAAIRPEPGCALRQALPAAGHGADLWRRPACRRRLHRTGARAPARRSTMRSTRRPTIPSRPTPASPPTSASSPTACQTVKRGLRRSSLAPAAQLPGRRFLLGGLGWDDKPMPDNVRRLGHVRHRRAQRVQLHPARPC